MRQVHRLSIVFLTALLIALPSASLAKKKGSDDHPGQGIGRGGVPALRDRIVVLEQLVLDLQERVEELEGMASDDDGDGFSENQGDCDDSDALVSPGAAEQPGNGIDDDCDGEIDEGDAL